MTAMELITCTPRADCETMPVADIVGPKTRCGQPRGWRAGPMLSWFEPIAQNATHDAQSGVTGRCLIRVRDFARHLRTKIEEESGVWRADAVYTVTPALPRGVRTIDIDVVGAPQAEKTIPTV